MSINVGDKVQTGVFVAGEFVPTFTGTVVKQSPDGSTSQVDVGSLHGAAPRLHWEATSHLRKVDL